MNKKKTVYFSEKIRLKPTNIYLFYRAAIFQNNNFKSGKIFTIEVKYVQRRAKY